MILKEFYKFKNVYFIFVIISLAYILYIYLHLQNAVLQKGSDMVNLIFLYQKGFSFYHLDSLNLFFGLCMGSIVFFKERIGGRLRVSLHFPNSTFVNISYIVCVGLGFLLSIYILEFVLLGLILSQIYVKEIVEIICFSLLLNFLFGMCFYLFSASLIIESKKKQILVNFCVFCAVLYLYFELNPDIYQLESFYSNSLGIYYFIFCLAYALSALITAFINYKKGYIR